MTKAVIFESTPLPKNERDMNALIANTFHRVCSGYPVDVLDIPIVFRAAREAILAGADKKGLEQAIKDCVSKIQYEYKGE